MNVLQIDLADSTARTAVEASSHLGTGFDPSSPFTQEADRHLQVLSDGQMVARASLWWTNSPQPGLGVLGHLAIKDGDEALEASRSLLSAAESELSKAGCHTVVGPMDGNTWRSYRLVTWSTPGVPPFVLEPQTPAAYPGFLEAAGWERQATYSSSRLALDPPDERARQRVDRFTKRLDREGVSIRSIDLSDLVGELGRCHELAVSAFADNHLYTPLSREEFIGMYQKVSPLLIADFILVAERNGEVAGLCFALPDTRNDGYQNLIVKTLAVRPDCRRLGLGFVLTHLVQEAGRLAGFSHAIHALQFEDNDSLKITDRQGGERIREYALFGKEIG